MQILALLKTLIYLVASSLFFPVVFILACLLVWMLVYSGRFFRRWLERQRTKKGSHSEQLPETILKGASACKGHLPMTVIQFITSLERLNENRACHASSFSSAASTSASVTTAMATSAVAHSADDANAAHNENLNEVKGTDRSVWVLNLLRDAEHRLWKSLDSLKMIIRIGPGLGLIGTLIPMGTGLAALGQGDLGQLSQDLVVAFTTTVVGMALGLLSYFFFTIQRRWVEQDIKNMELAAELLCNDNPQDEKSSKTMEAYSVTTHPIIGGDDIATSGVKALRSAGVN